MDTKLEKLSEARHFLDRMKSNQGNQYEFNFDLSAFLTAARSVLQYIHKEVSGVTKAQKWYDRKLTCSTTLTLFRDLRNDNAHEVPVATTKHATSAGQRTHYFRSKYTRAEVLELAESYVTEIEDLLFEGFAAHYLRKGT